MNVFSQEKVSTTKELAVFTWLCNLLTCGPEFFVNQKYRIPPMQRRPMWPTGMHSNFQVHDICMYTMVYICMYVPNSNYFEPCENTFLIQILKIFSMKFPWKRYSNNFCPSCRHFFYMYNVVFDFWYFLTILCRF